MTYRCHYRGAESVIAGRRWLPARVHAGVSRHPTSTRGLIAAPWTPASRLLCCAGRADGLRSRIETLRLGD